MAFKWNQFTNRFLKSLSSLTVTFLLLSILLIPICAFSSAPLQDAGSIDPLVVFSGIALVLCLCIFIPIKAIKIIAKIVLSLGALCSAYFYLPIGFDLLSIVKLFIHVLFWLVTVCTACKEGGGTEKQRFATYVDRKRSFKKFSIFIGCVFVIGSIVLFFVDYTLVISPVADLLWAVALYIIVQAFLIRVSRDAVYAEIKSLDGLRITKSTILFGVGCGVGTALLFIFKKALNRLLVKWIEATNRFFLTVTKLYKNFIAYIEKLIAAITLRKAQDDYFFNPSVSKDDILKDFGLGDLPIGGGGGGIGGNGGNGGGGIGSIGGINGSLGDILGDVSGGLGGYGLAGLIGGSLSESGNLGVGDNPEAILGSVAAMAFVRTETSSPVYLKLKSFGDYNGQGWNEATEYSQLLENSYSMNYLSGAALSNDDIPATGIEIISLTGQYFLPDYLAMGYYGYEIQSSDVYAKGDASEMYSLKYYDYSAHIIERSVPYEYYMAEQEYGDFVREQYLQLPQSTYSQITDFLNLNGIYEGRSDSVHMVFKLLSHYTYNLEYDKTLDKEKDVVLSFLTEYEEGICQHFASASVVMFRALGIPARYVGGLHVANTRAGEWTVVVSNAAHAWVEIYQSGVGWVRLDPTQYAQYTGPDLEDSFNKDEYDDLIQKNPNGDWNDNISGGGGGSWGDDSSNSGGGWDDDSSDGGGGWGDDSSDGGDDSDDDSSNSGGGWDDDSSNSGGGWDDDSSNSGDDSADDDSSSGGSDKDSSTSSSKDTDSDSSKPDDVSSESSKDSLESSESQSSEAFGCNDVPWLPIGIGAAVIAGTIVTVLLIRLLKKPKRKMKKVDLAKKNLTEEETLLLEEEIHRAAAQIIRENYKDFIKLAGKNGIRKYPIDTTRSLRNRYNREIGENEAIEILTKLYRIARYNKNEKLTADDANESTYCLDVIQKEVAKKKKEKEKPAK